MDNTNISRASYPPSSFSVLTTPSAREIFFNNRHTLLHKSATPPRVLQKAQRGALSMVFAMVFVGEIYEGSPLNLLPLQHIDLHNLLDGVFSRQKSSSSSSPHLPLLRLPPPTPPSRSRRPSVQDPDWKTTVINIITARLHGDPCTRCTPCGGSGKDACTLSLFAACESVFIFLIADAITISVTDKNRLDRRT